MVFLLLIPEYSMLIGAFIFHKIKEDTACSVTNCITIAHDQSIDTIL